MSIDERFALRRISETYPAPTLDDVTGRPVDWRPTGTVDEALGIEGIHIDGVNVTLVRGVRTRIDSLSWQEPFGDGPGQLTVLGASAWDRGRTGFEWLAVENNVDINLYDLEGHFIRPLWSGIVLTVQWSGGGWTLGLEGAFAGVSGMLPHRPKLTEAERDVGKAMTYAIRRAGRAAARRKTITEVTFGITTRDRGARSETLLEYIQRLLGTSQTLDGDRWTLARALHDDGSPIQRKYEWRLKDQDTVAFTVRNEQRGVALDLRQDFSDVERLQMAEGVDRDGGRWRNTKLPNVGKETIPDWPGYNLVPGLTNDDNVLVWQIEAMTDGLATGDLDALSDGDYGDREVEAAKEIQDRAGLPVTGIVDHDTWDATWSNGESDLNMGGARFDPIWSEPDVRPFLCSSNGSVMAVNPAWDRTKIPVGRFVSYGQDVTRAQAKRSARAEIARAKTPGWSGTITLDGVDPAEMSRLLILEGMNVQVLDFDDDPVLHIAEVTWRPSGPSYAVELSVDQRARDWLTIADIRARNRDAKADPAKLAIAQLRRSAQVRDTPSMWDTEGGFGWLPVRDAVTGWNVYKIAAGKYGSLSRVKIRTNPHGEFAVALFGDKVTRGWLAGIMPDPLADPGDNQQSVWDEPGIQDDLRSVLFIEAFGEHDNPLGYSPRYKHKPSTGTATGAPITGLGEVLSSTDYAVENEPLMFLAIYIPGDDCKVKGHIYLLPNE